MSMDQNGTWNDNRPEAVNAPAGPDTLLDATREIVLVMWRRKLWIAATALIAILLAILFLAFTDPLYSSSSKILIEPRPRQILQTEVVPTGLGNSSMGSDTLLVDSQVEIIRSDAILGRVVDATDLANEPEFARSRGGGISSMLLGIGRSPAHASPTAAQDLRQTPRSAAIENLRRRLTVGRTGNTYLVDISVMSQQAHLAQLLADAVAEAYIADVEDAAREGTRQTTAMLSARLERLRDDLREREREVDAYREEHGLIGSQDLAINEQQLSSVNDRLTAARARTSEARVKYERLTQMASQGVNGVESTREALESSVIASLRSAHAQVEGELSNAALVYGPRHPRVTGLQTQRRTIEQTITEELGRLARAAQAEYEIARQDEEALSARLAELESNTVGANRTLVSLRELEREAQAARSVYEAFLTRTRQAGEQENLSASNSRILARAELPYRPAYPPASIVLAAALMLGLIFGVMLAWVRDVLFAPRQRYEAGRPPAPDRPGHGGSVPHLRPSASMHRLRQA